MMRGVGVMALAVTPKRGPLLGCSLIPVSSGNSLLPVMHKFQQRQCLQVSWLRDQQSAQPPELTLLFTTLAQT